ncbi:MAG: ATP-binding protein [Thermoplasmata archaeon]
MYPLPGMKIPNTRTSWMYSYTGLKTNHSLSKKAFYRYAPMALALGIPHYDCSHYEHGHIMFHDRKDEMETLRKAYESDKAEFVVIYGRRRIGKTSLIKEIAKEHLVVYYFAERLPLKEQALDFANQVSNEFNRFPPKVENWKESFEYTLSLFDGRIFIALDEFPYLINGDGRTLSHYQKLWDEYLSKEDIVLVLIGSSISIMENEVLNYKSPLFGRRTKQMEVKDLPIQCLKDFFPRCGLEDIIRVYGVCGGVPAYPQRFDDSIKFWKNISNNFCKQDEYMYGEPDFILQQELREPSTYRMILAAISGGKHKIGQIAN